MRAPAVPLITVDPYFSIWSKDENLTYTETVHWTGSEMPVFGYLNIDGERFAFLGFDRDAKKLPQKSLSVSALTTEAVYATEKIEFRAKFTSTLFLDDPKLMSRPVSYVALSYRSLDGKKHVVKAEMYVREAICQNTLGDHPIVIEQVGIEGIPTVKMGNEEQEILKKSGDNVRIDWGYFYLSVADGNAEVGRGYKNRNNYVNAKSVLSEGEGRLFLLSYDDIYGIDYFGTPLKSVWNSDGTTIGQAIAAAADEYGELSARAERFSADLYAKAEAAGGKKYAEIVTLAYRQTVSAHKAVVDGNGDVLFISKECFSGGFTATVDVSYPSTPLFLIYNPGLVRGMLRPVYKFAESERWKFDFAPHDTGMYPLVTGQLYGYDRETDSYRFDKQMPVEECGNMIIMETAAALADGDFSFAESHIGLLEKWCRYLIKYGEDPENQLCTDDFAGHLAHNCNLSLKAVMGIAGMAILLKNTGRERDGERYMRKARKMARSWLVRAANGDGSYRLAFDLEGSYSMKYNMVWDKLWGTKLFPKKAVARELKSNFTHMNGYGMPLDSRADYTKSDWLVWTATMLESKRDFERYVAPLWRAYDESPSRVPMTDWYDTKSAYQISFQNRTVQGGLFMKMLAEENRLRKK
ncbi:MAG: DUF4965 domain-containing protein [Clostridia bacterium]|nr:DUF4965 domain-containing protein [Clostridia bacterium]